MARMTRDEVTKALIKLGWNRAGLDDDKRYRDAVENFQRGWALDWPPLLVDGKAGPKTAAALEESLARLKAGHGTASRHFSYSEWACKCGGRYANCQRIRVHRALLRGLEELRASYYPDGLSPVSGYRCPSYNQSVGGASSSQHMYGAACDLPPAVTARDVARLDRFSGIGTVKATGLVAHVDVRHRSGNNTTGGTPERPTLWLYY